MPLFLPNEDVHRWRSRWQELLKQHTDIQRLWKRLPAFPEQGRQWMADAGGHGIDPFGTTSTSTSSSSTTRDCAFSDTQVSDSFTDTNGTGLASHTPDTDVEGGGWTDSGGDFDIQSNQASTNSATTGGVFAGIDGGGIGDGILSADLTPGANGGFSSFNRVGLRFRASSGDNSQWLVRVDEVNDLFELVKLDGVGNPSVIDSASVTINSATTYTVEVTFCGNDITTTLDGGNTLSADDGDNSSETIVGLYLQQFGGDGAAAYDNFLFKI